MSLQLGPKAGVVAGNVTDALTGKLLYPCAEIKLKAKPSNFVRGTGLVSAKYRVLVPSSQDVILEVWLDGYEQWFYPGTVDEASAQAIRLQPSEELKLQIRMYPDSANKSGCGIPVGTVVSK